MSVEVLVVSSLYDFSIDLVVQEFERRGTSYLRLNKESFPDYRLTFNLANQTLSANVSGTNYTVNTDVKSILYRQPIFLRNTPGESLTIQEQLTRSQWMGFLRSLTIFRKSRWMNSLDSTYLAETKAYQLVLANNIGFKVPKTLIGNDANPFKQFSEEVIIKSLDTVLLREGNDCLFTYSTIKDVNELNDDVVHSAPLTVQEYLTPKIDIRVTIVGKKVFSVKITSNGQGIDGDWRLVEREKVEYTDIEIPRNIELCCLRLMEELNLSFGAIDLIQRGQDYIFIEINPTGEWGWLVESHRRIDQNIADWLLETI